MSMGNFRVSSCLIPTIPPRNLRNPQLLLTAVGGWFIIWLISAFSAVKSSLEKIFENFEFFSI